MYCIDTSAFEVNILCPFCEELLVKDYDIDLLVQNLSDSEEVSELEENLPEPIWSLSCPHVAATCVWGFTEAEASTSWKDIMESFLLEFSDYNSLDYLLDGWNAELEKKFNSIYPDFEVRYINVYVEQFKGLKEGGPRFLILLIRNPK